ncbi:hypothetical protein ABWW58_14040 [Sporolactobacillus sp. STCC-11]|uniref:hypothetical protein n=1 Tax=Sporolactobacillus caesalpiniae TaxID=3230362 RepID=UPI003393C5DD
MFQRVSTCVISALGIIAAMIQSLFGGFSYLAARMDSGVNGYLRIENDRMTSIGALNSLLSFGSHAFIAGLLCALLSSFALYLYIKKGKKTLSGLCFLVAGSLNCLILFGTGLPVGILLVLVGMVVMAGKSDVITHKPPFINKNQMSE